MLFTRFSLKRSLAIRWHHLLKTFGDWRDRQWPDGTVVWTCPRGQTYTTHPGSKLLFPQLCRPTAPVVVSDIPGTATPGRTLLMPRRTRTRIQNRAQAFDNERAGNQTLVETEAAQRNKPPPF